MSSMLFAQAIADKHFLSTVMKLSTGLSIDMPAHHALPAQAIAKKNLFLAIRHEALELQRKRGGVGDPRNPRVSLARAQQLAHLSGLETRSGKKLEDTPRVEIM